MTQALDKKILLQNSRKFKRFKNISVVQWIVVDSRLTTFGCRGFQRSF